MGRRGLIIRLSSLGDVLLTFPTIHALAAQGVEVGYVTREEWQGVVRRLPAVRRVFTIGPRRGGNSGAAACVKSINAEFEPDFVLDLHGVPLSRYIAAGVEAPAKSTYRKHAFRRGLLAFTGLDLLPRPTVGVVDLYARAARPWGVSRADRTCRVPLDGPATAALRRRLGYDAGWFVLAPGARHAPKTWPPPKWRELARLLNAWGERALLVGDEGERELCAEIANGLAGVVNAAGRIDPEEAFETLADAKALVTNDSAWSHVAPLVGVPCLTLFGPTSPRFGFAPWGPRDRALYLGLPCSPCSKHGARRCWRDKRYCLEDIAVDAALTALREMGVLV